MELMSSAFLCVLVALLPQTLGIPKNKNILKVDAKIYNNSMVVRQNTSLRKTILMNINGPPLVSNINELQSVFNDLACRPCTDCMEKAIKAYYIHLRKHSIRPSVKELRDDILTNEINHRPKRDISDSLEKAAQYTRKKLKSKKNKTPKVTVTRYNVDSDIYALKVKETKSTNGNNVSNSQNTCQVYSINKSFPCDSPEADSLISSARMKDNKKKNKKEQDKKSASTTVKTHTFMFKKREVDNSQVPENFMTSIEDIY